jgi:hypothetical protein
MSGDSVWKSKEKGWRGRYEEISTKEKRFHNRETDEVVARWYGSYVDVSPSEDRLMVDGEGLFEIDSKVKRGEFIILDLVRWD